MNFHVEMGTPPLTDGAPCQRLAVGNVHRDFHAEPEVDGLRGFPFHTESPRVDEDFIIYRRTVPRISSIMNLAS
jgi:hypothetical protein